MYIYCSALCSNDNQRLMFPCFLAVLVTCMYLCICNVVVVCISGLPSSAPNITAIRPLNDTSFTVNWTISDISYNYTVIWTNLNTSVTVSFTVSENTSSYTVAGLSKYYNYNVCVAIIGLCEMMISGCIIVYG